MPESYDLTPISSQAVAIAPPSVTLAPAVARDPFAEASFPRAVPAPTRGGATLTAFLRLKWLMAGISGIILAITMPVIWLGIVPQYRGKATIEVLPSNPRVLYRTEENGVLPYHQQFLNSQPGVIRGVTIVKSVLERPDVKATAWYKAPRTTWFGGGESRLGELRELLTVEPRGGTYLIDVSMADRNKRDAEIIVNAVVDEYLSFSRERSHQTNDVVYQRLVESKTELEAEIETRKAAHRDLQRSLGSSTPTDAVGRRKAWVEERQSKLDDIRREIATAEWQEKELAAVVEAPTTPAAADGKPALDAGHPFYLDDPEWRRLHLELKTLRHEIDSNPRQIGPSHPDMIAKVKRIDLLEDMLTEQQGRIDQAWRISGGKSIATGSVNSPTGELVILRRQIGRLKKQEELLSQEIKVREVDYELTFANAEELTREHNAVRYLEEKLDLVRRRLDEKETEAGISMAIRPVGPAFAPAEPDHDRRRLLSIAAVMGALVAGVAAAYLRITTAPQIFELTDVPQGSQSPFLGRMPLLRSPDNPDAHEACAQTESIRVLRTALLQRINGQPSSAVLVTSAGPGAGKTTFACMLARSLAQMGKRVLLVDTDLRNPSVSGRFNIRTEHGLIDLLLGRLRDQEAIRICDMPGLSIMPAGGRYDSSDPEILANGAFSACLDRWRKRFDVILLDAPPILPVADALILARQVDGAVMMVRERVCRRAEVTEAMASLATSGARMYGTVFLGTRQLEQYRYRYAAYAGREPGADMDVHGA